MKIVLTGSLGNISKPLAQQLIQQGHTVTIISRNEEKSEEISQLGASSAAGSVTDASFLTQILHDADAVYCMVPPNYTAPDILAHYRAVGDAYAKAIKDSGVKRVIHLSSFGGQLAAGTGLIRGSHYVEEALNALSGISLTHMRPTSFYYNLLHFIPVIKASGNIIANYGEDDLVLWVSPSDIAEAVAEELVKTESQTVRYVSSDEGTCNEVAGIIGKAIGKPSLKWIKISDEEMLAIYKQNGMKEETAGLYVELYAALRSGDLARNYYLHPPVKTGKVKIEDYAREFAAIFAQQKEH